MLEPGDMLAMVTDGATEALSPAGEEFGDDRGCGRRSRPAPAGRGRDALDSLVSAVDAWTGAAGCSDDLTALILKAHDDHDPAPPQHPDRPRRRLRARRSRPRCGMYVCGLTVYNRGPHRQLPHLRGHGPAAPHPALQG